MLANSLIFLPIAGLVLAAASGVLIRTRRERDDKQARESFKIDHRI
jgi:LPXTG-motif cell wall-anchored protein